MRTSIERTLRGLGRRDMVALVLALALLVVAAVLFAQSVRLADDPATENRALLDSTRSAEVERAVTGALTQVLSYDWQQPDATRAFADRALTGQAREEFDTLFTSLQERAPGQKLVLSAQVQVAGVRELGPDDATLLVFLDQRSTRAKDEQASVSAAQLLVTAERRGAGWTITGLKPL